LHSLSWDKTLHASEVTQFPVFSSGAAGQDPSPNCAASRLSPGHCEDDHREFCTGAFCRARMAQHV